MSRTDSSTPTTQTIADSLREVADWFDAHPELQGQYGSICVRLDDRADAEALARALGPNATERPNSVGTTVHITGSVAPKLEVYGMINVARLTGAPPPAYRPIIPPRDEADQ